MTSVLILAWQSDQDYLVAQLQQYEFACNAYFF